MSMRSSTTPTGPSSSSRTRAAVARSGRTSRSRSAPTRPGTCPSPRSVSSSVRASRSSATSIGNDVSSRDIEGANPLYLPQAKVFAAACAIGPAVYVPEDWEAPLEISLTIRDADGTVLFAGETSTARMKRTFTDLVGWLIRDNPVPPGSVLLTGTGLVPPDDFTLLPGHVVEIHVPEIGTLTNPVVVRRRPAREELPLTEIPFQDDAAWLSESSSPASSAASAPGSRAACSTTATTSSATTSATPRHRLELVLGDDIDRLEIVKGDITELAARRAGARRARDHARRPPRRAAGAVRAGQPAARHARQRGRHRQRLRRSLASSRPDPGRRVRELVGDLQRVRPLPRPRDRRHEPVDPLRRLEARGRGHRARLRSRRRRVVDRPAPLRRLRPRPRPGDDVGPDGGDARRGPRRGRRTSASRAWRSTTTPPTSHGPR